MTEMRRSANMEWQVNYIIDEIKKALSLDGEYGPSDIVDAVRFVRQMLDERDSLKAKLATLTEAVKGLPKVEGQIIVACLNGQWMVKVEGQLNQSIYFHAQAEAIAYATLLKLRAEMGD